MDHTALVLAFCLAGNAAAVLTLEPEGPSELVTAVMDLSPREESPGVPGRPRVLMLTPGQTARQSKVSLAPSTLGVAAEEPHGAHQVVIVIPNTGSKEAPQSLMVDVACGSGVCEIRAQSSPRRQQTIDAHLHEPASQAAEAAHGSPPGRSDIAPSRT